MAERVKEFALVNASGAQSMPLTYAELAFVDAHAPLAFGGGIDMADPVEARFWSNVSFGRGARGCWLWTGHVSEKGYGLMAMYLSRGCQNIQAHRYSFSTFRAEIPKGMLVCHRCDVPNCVNPGHLFLGTVKANNDDKELKGRGNHDANRGEGNGMAKLTVAQVQEIRRRVGVGEKKRTLAREYGVSDTLIRLIGKGQAWAHL